MATFNITLSQEEILQLFESQDKNAALKELMSKTLNSFLEYESREQLNAEKYERSEKREDYRNGTRDREVTYRIGKIDLHVPRHRNVPFHTMLLENYERSEAALVATMAEMVVEGVSTRKVAQIMEVLCGKEFSRSTVSEACKDLDEYVKEYRTRPLSPGKYPFLIVDATYFKCREDHRITSVAFMVAIGVTLDGKREVIGFDVYDDESSSTWNSFIESLKKRGLSGVMMYTSDAHLAIRNAMSNHFPAASWQRCQFHFLKNILTETPKKYQKGLESELKEMFNCKTVELARSRRDEIIRDYSDVAEKAMEILDSGFDDAVTVFILPSEMRVHLRTSNTIERLNGELKRRSSVIRIFPNRGSVLRLMGSVTINYSESMKKKVFYTATSYRFTEEVRIKLGQIAAAQLRALTAA